MPLNKSVGFIVAIIVKQTFQLIGHLYSAVILFLIDKNVSYLTAADEIFTLTLTIEKFLNILYFNEMFNYKIWLSL